MKKLLFGTLLLTSALFVAIPTTAAVNVNIALPPPIVFAAPPVLIVLPETYVYVAPDVGADIFFYNGWWWRPWEGRWYRSRYYNEGWAYYNRVPSFYARIPSSWRNDYRDHRWNGYEWNYQRIPHQQVQKNWKSWEQNRYWEKQQTWGVQGLPPRTRTKQPARDVHSQQSRPQEKEVKSEQPQQQQHEASPQSGEGKQQHPQQHGEHEKGEK